jgi:histidyl-tRNA synthetase
VQAQLADAPLMIDHLCGECRDHYDEVREHLREHGITWTEAPRLVRGLDYYTRTTFEFEHPLLGAQSGIGGGGRYDGLMAALGGPALPGIGFGIGTDRTLLAREAEGLPPLAAPAVHVYGIGLGEAGRRTVTAAMAALRRSGIPADSAMGRRGLKGAMKAADRSGARWVLIVGDDEAAAGTAQVKDLTTGQQQELPAAEVPAFIARSRSEEDADVAQP